MLRGLYTAAAGMIAQQQRHDAITNNISNLNTPGYKQANTELRAFPQMLISRIMNGGSSQIGALNTGVLAEENVMNFKQGTLHQTKQPFDFALVSNIQVPGLRFNEQGKAVKANGTVVYQPQAFFTVQDANRNILYTQDGHFTVNGQGQLVTADGYQVLDQNHQPIVLTDPNTGLPASRATVTPNGQFLNGQGLPLNGANGQPVSLLLSRIDRPNQLIPAGNSVYRLNSNGSGNGNTAKTVSAKDQVAVRQGTLEQSNVNPTEMMVSMQDSLRMYEANQKLIQYYDRSLNQTVNQVGKI